VALEPKKRRGDQKAAHLVAPEIKDRRIPFGMKSLTRIGVFVEMRTVEKRQAMRVRWEMRRDPVQDHADAALMQVIDEIHEILWRTVARGRCKVSGGLIAP